MPSHLIISTATDLVRVSQDHIIYISSDGNYSTLILSDGEARLITFQLGQVERIIAEQLGYPASENFIRIGKQLIINRSYIYYINLPKQQLVLSDNSVNKYTVSASREALKRLKDLVESENIC